MPDPPPCTSYANGSVSNYGMQTDQINPSGFTLGGQLRGWLTGTAPSGCQPYRLEAEVFIDWRMTISIGEGQIIHYPFDDNTYEEYPLGRVGGDGGILNGANYTAYTNYCHIYKTGTTSPIDFQAMFNALFPNSGYTLTTVQYVPRIEFYLGQGTPFNSEVHQSFPGSMSYLPV